MPRQVDVDRQPLAVVGSVDRDGLELPLVGFDRLADARSERRAVVDELACELREGAVVDRLLARVVADGHGQRLGERDRHGRAGQLADAAEAVGGAAVEGRLRVGIVEGVGRIGVAAAEDVAFLHVARGVARPLAHVAGDVVDAEGTDARQAAGGRGALAAEVAERQQELGVPAVGHLRIVIHGRQLLARPGRIRGRLVPGDARHRMLGEPVRIRARLPGRRAWPAGAIGEARERRGERDFFPALHHRDAPVRRVRVTARVDEGLVVAVGDLVPVGEEPGHLDAAVLVKADDVQFGIRSGDPHHVGRERVGTIDRQRWHIPSAEEARTDELDRLVPLLADLDAQQVARHARVLERGCGRETPWRIGCAVVLPVDPGAGRLGLDRQRRRNLRPELCKRGIMRQRLLGLERYVE